LLGDARDSEGDSGRCRSRCARLEDQIRCSFDQLAERFLSVADEKCQDLVDNEILERDVLDGIPAFEELRRCAGRSADHNEKKEGHNAEHRAE
jgi:hypothetical protein